MTYAMRLLVKDSNGQSLSFESLETELIDGLLTAVNETTCANGFITYTALSEKNS